ncbi:hypothetical protein C7B13_24290 [Escherichia coli]|nr:hypothetical protein C7B13_24290 [Escherichia coli]
MQHARIFMKRDHPITAFFKETNLFDYLWCAHSFGFIFHYHVLSVIMAASPDCLCVPSDND